MPTSSKIFISSVAQDAITHLRIGAFEELSRLGHDPQMFEKNFGPWPNFQTGVDHCLKKVSECDLYCLFIHTKGGSMTSNGYTVTHLEYLRAVSDSKMMMLYCESTIMDAYFKFRWIIAKYIEEFKLSRGRMPHNNEVVDFLEMESEKNPASGIPSKHQIDTYVWVLLHDIVMVKGHYVEKLSWGHTVPWASYLSDLLQQGLQLLPKKSLYEESSQLALAFGDFTSFAKQVVSDHVRISELLEGRRLLNRSIRMLTRSEITAGPVNGSIGSVKACSAICLFHHEGNSLTVQYYAGDTNGNYDFEVGDPSSFVSYTYNNLQEGVPGLFYWESRRLFYLTYKLGEYVISYHFPEDTAWSSQLYADYTDDIINGILNTHANGMIIELLNSLIGGLQK